MFLHSWKHLRSGKSKKPVNRKRMKWLWWMLLPTGVNAIIKAISFYGLETEQRDFVCSDVHKPKYYLEYLKDLGFNSIRVPFSTLWVEEGRWDKLDSFMDECYRLKFDVYFDHHRIFPDRQDESPLERGMTMDRYLRAWYSILNRYKLYDNLVGINAWNEFVSTNASFVNDLTSQVFNEVEKNFPERFEYVATGVLWSGKLEGVDVDYLPFKDRIRYSLHKYVFSIGVGEEYETSWVRSLAHHPPSRVVIGEYGWLPQDTWWGERFVYWLKSVGIKDTFFWTIARSDGTGGLWQDDCKTFEADKFRLIHRLWSDKHLRG
jgi:hypothetical protein